ncbi:MAG: hypothetical protein JNJ70_13135 [Verrucomicrobiales bacterium]|nr:hypothetical protein [Verrucomicrobiales bacterium]
MPAKNTKIQKPTEHSDVDARIGNAVVEVRFGVDAVRTLRTSLMQVAYTVSEDPALHGYVVLADSSIAMERVREEWQRASSVLRPEVQQRLTICMASDQGMLGIPSDPDSKTEQMVAGVIESQRGKAGGKRTDYSFIILKLLIHQWFTSGEPVTAEWLARTAGCHYPAVARALRPLGGLVERTSDRRVLLRWFPEDEFARMIAISDRARSTMRFADPSGQPRSIESHLRRLEKLAPPGLAVGGVLGATHHFPGLDLVGSPRLDLSLHCPGKHMNLEFIKALDPALKPVSDPLQPAIVVVHAVRHADPLFAPREGGLAWADPVECLLDLHEAKLDMQAGQFRDYLESTRPAKS